MITLYDYLKMSENDFDTYDTTYDAVVTVCYIADEDEKDEYDKFCNGIIKRVNVIHIDTNYLTVNWTELIERNIDKFKAFTKENWYESCQYEDDEDEEKSSFKGAINAEPKWNDNIGIVINGIRSNCIYKNPTDFDMGAFYPSIKIACNMDPGTLLFKAAFVNEEFISGEMSNRSLNTTYFEKDKNGNIRKLDITGEAVNTYVSGNILTTGYNYMGLPSISSLMAEVERNIR